MAKYLEHWDHLVKDLEVVARSARAITFKESQHKDKSVYHAQLRLIDSPELLDVHIRRVDQALPFLPLDAALESFEKTEPHPLPCSQFCLSTKLSEHALLTMQDALPRGHHNRVTNDIGKRGPRYFVSMRKNKKIKN